MLEKLFTQRHGPSDDDGAISAEMHFLSHLRVTLRVFDGHILCRFGRNHMFPTFRLEAVK
jgi:hypothetical protein